MCILSSMHMSILFNSCITMLTRRCTLYAGPGELPGLTDEDKPRLRGPKRASKIRKLFNLTKEDDVRKDVNTYRRKFEGKDGKTHSKAPKIQRLVTPLTLQRKRRRASLKRQAHEKVSAGSAVVRLAPLQKEKNRGEEQMMLSGIHHGSLFHRDSYKDFQPYGL